MQASERFLQHMVSLYVASHYKNTPNDLILMSDAPAHHLFVLLGPVDETQVGRRGEKRVKGKVGGSWTTRLCCWDLWMGYRRVR